MAAILNDIIIEKCIKLDIFYNEHKTRVVVTVNGLVIQQTFHCRTILIF